MISVEAAFEAASHRGLQEHPLAPELSDDEETRLNYIDATIDTTIYKSFVGEMIEVDIPADVVGVPAVLQGLRERYESGGWQVGIMPVRQGDDVMSFRVVFAPGTHDKTVKLKPQPNKKTLPPIASLDAGAARDLRLHVCMPTRARPAQALSVLEKYRSMAGIPITIEVVVDHDDETMHTAEVQQRLAAIDCIVTTGKHTSKIAACNGGRFSDWDVFLLASDDMVPVKEDYAVRILQAMQEHWPYLDGALYFDDGFQHRELCTLPIFGRRLYEQFGYVYEPTYRSLFCDTEQTHLLKSMGRLTYVHEKLIEHRHPAWGRAEKDELYVRNDALESADKKIFELRKQISRPHAQWAFDAPPLWLSLCICTVPSRRPQLDWLLRQLWNQIMQSGPRQVEILVDAGASTVGEKRQALVERAKGHFVAFIDDDDGVAPDYVARVLQTVKTHPEVDCTSLNGIITTNGGMPQEFRHSIAYDGWYAKDGVNFRTPNHLNAVKRELALQVGFIAKNVGEDLDFSMRLRPLLKKEASTGDRPLYYYWYNGTRSVQGNEA